MKNRRVCLYVSDIMIWTGKSRRWSQMHLSRIREELGKTAWQPLTIGEYCRHMNIDPDDLPPLT